MDIHKMYGSNGMIKEYYSAVGGPLAGESMAAYYARLGYSAALAANNPGYFNRPNYFPPVAPGYPANYYPSVVGQPAATYYGPPPQPQPGYYPQGGFAVPAATYYGPQPGYYSQPQPTGPVGVSAPSSIISLTPAYITANTVGGVFTDPNTGLQYAINPQTGNPIDPNTGYDVNLNTGQDIYNQ